MKTMKFNKKLVQRGYRMTRLSWLKDKSDNGEVWVSYLEPEVLEVEAYAMYNSQPLRGFFIKGFRNEPAYPYMMTPEDRVATDWIILGGEFEGQVYEQDKHLLEPDLPEGEQEVQDDLVFSSDKLRAEIIRGLRLAQKGCHQDMVKAGWWTDLKTGEDLRDTDGTGIKRNTGELMLLVDSEVAEAYEGYRKDLMDDHLTHRKMEEVELADAVFRIFDLADSKGYDLATALVEKADYNRKRADHKLENRRLANGKKS